MFKNYLVTTYRNLFRNKINTIINITGLTVSIACCVFIYVFVRHEKTFDSFHANADRIYRIVSDDKNTQGASYQGYVSFPVAKALRNDFPNLETVTQVYVNNTAVVSINDASTTRKVFEEKEMTFADEYFLKTFDYPVLAGQKTGLLASPDEVVLTRELADRFFGKEFKNSFDKLIGKTLTINKSNYKISAILENIPRNTNVTFKMLLPFKDFARNNTKLVENWKDNYSESYTFVTVPTNYRTRQFEADLVNFKNKYLDRESAQRTTFHAQPLSKVHTEEKYGGTYYATPSILIIAFVCMGIIVLLTACINFINLATAQSFKRAKEVGIRKVLGSNKWQLMLQFMGETFILILIASVAGLLLADQFLSAFNNYLSFIVDLGLHIDSTIIIFLAGLSILVTFLAGYYPARSMTNFAPIKALKHTITGRNTGLSSRFSLRKILVVTQFTVSQVLVFGTIIVATQMKHFYTQDLGFKKEGILTVEIPENNPQKRDLFRNHLLSQAQVGDVSFNSGPPTSASNSYSEFRRKDAPQTEKVGVERKFVDHHYIPTYNIKLIAGRNLEEADKVAIGDTSKKYNVVVNKKAVNVLGYANAAQALNQTIIVNEKDEATIVGVTDNFYNVSLQKEIDPCLLFYGTNWVPMAAIKTNTGSISTLLPFVKQKWEELYPDQVFKSLSLTDYFKYKAFYVLEDIMYQGFKIFALLSIIIGCLGLYGLVSFLAIQRQKEIGIRKVLGASVQGIVYMFSKEFVILVIIAFLLAAPLGYMAMSAWLQTFANRISISPFYFVIAFLLSLIVACCTVGFKAIAAALANPVKSLRTE
ncbi:ABC transporter permease [Segetibacter aerophilus]|uniref:ABC transporter permease n=1 Tax=Segetibacter aerophilus TaxID=670293 RepID=A0A512BB61_9BACT|nr:ABC transporter permease [Segetibacter aerophilus]GEO09203.1 ABC transporter permease [Segetibacter aerophilus]